MKLTITLRDIVDYIVLLVIIVELVTHTMDIPMILTVVLLAIATMHLRDIRNCLMSSHRVEEKTEEEKSTCTVK